MLLLFLAENRMKGHVVPTSSPTVAIAMPCIAPCTNYGVETYDGQTRCANRQLPESPVEVYLH